MNGASSLSTHHIFHDASVLLGLAAGLIFIMDLISPWNLGGGIPYIAVVVLSLRHNSPFLPLWVATGCSALIFIAAFISAPIQGWELSLVPRIWALLVVWTTALLCRVSLQQGRIITEQENRLLVYEHIFQRLPDSFCVVGTDYRIRQVNQAYCRLHRLSSDKLVGAHIAETLDSQVFVDQVRPVLDRCFRGDDISKEGWVPCQDGKFRYMAVSYLPLAPSRAPSRDVMIMSRDLTAEKHAADARHAGEQHLRTILDSLPNFVGIGTVDGVVLDCNLAPLQMSGIKKEDVVGVHVVNTYWINHSPQTQEQVQQILQRAARGETVRADIHARMGENSFMTVDAWIIPVLDATGHVIRVVLSGVDVTARRQVELALQHSKQEFQNLVDSLEGIIWECDFPSYQFTFVSRQAERLLGYPIDQWLSEPDFFCRHLHEDDRQWVVDFCKEATLRKHNHEMEYRFILPNGEALWLKDFITVVVEHDQPVKVRGVMFNMTQVKRAEDALRKSEERFRTYFETGLVGMAILSVDQHFLEVNECLCEMLGYSRDALRERTWEQLTHPDDLPADASQFGQLVAGNRESYYLHSRLLCAKNHFVHVNVYVNAVKNSEGAVEYVTAMIQDISQQKKAEEAVRMSDRLALATMNALPALICVLDDRGTILMVNDGWKYFVLTNGGDGTRLGVGADYFVFFTSMVPWATQHSLPALSAMREVLEGTREEFSYEYACAGSHEHQWFSCRIARFPAGGPLHAVVAHQEITEQKHAESRLREAEEFTTSILENLPNMVFVKDARALRFVRINQAGEQLLGFSRDHLVGKNDYDFFPKEEADFFTSKDRWVLDKGEMVDIPEEHIHTKNQGVRVLHTKKVPLYDQAGVPRFLLGISEDITKQKLVEDALRTSESTLKSFYDSAPMMMGIVELVDQDIRHLSDNKAAGEFFDRMPATRFNQLASARGIPSDVIDLWIERYRESGRLGRPVKFEYAHPNQTQLRWLSATVTPIGIPPVAHPRFAYIVEDITERKLLEDTIRTHAGELEIEVERRALRIRELEQRRGQVEKLAALAQVAAGIAHEINNPLASIAQSMVILKRTLPESHPKFKYFAKIQDCIERITHIIQQLYKLYRPDPSSPALIDIRPILESALEIMQPFAYQREITLTCTLPDHPVSISITRADLIQVLCNLIQNALDASSRHSNVVLTVTRQHGVLTICVMDQGPGIPPDISSHIFEPFFTTKEGSKKGGMGLGLAVSRSLVEGMGGTLRFSTTLGSGTSFMISFPESAGKDPLES